MAKETGLTVRGQPSTQSERGLDEATIKTVKKFYIKNEISWQAPGRKDRVIIHEVNSSGDKIKRTMQSRLLLLGKIIQVV